MALRTEVVIRRLKVDWTDFTNFRGFWQIHTYFDQTCPINKYSIKSKTPCINYMQYPWGYALPVSHIISTRESYPQYPWVISSVPVSHILSTRESYPQYPWGYAVLVREISLILHSYKLTNGYCISSRVLRIWLTGTEDMTHGYCIPLRVLRIRLTGTEDDCISSRVLRIWLTGTEDMTHGYWWYDSRVLHILMGTEDMTHG